MILGLWQPVFRQSRRSLRRTPRGPECISWAPGAGEATEGIDHISKWMSHGCFRKCTNCGNGCAVNTPKAQRAIHRLECVQYIGGNLRGAYWMRNHTDSHCDFVKVMSNFEMQHHSAALEQRTGAAMAGAFSKRFASSTFCCITPCKSVQFMKVFLLKCALPPCVAWRLGAIPSW